MSIKKLEFQFLLGTLITALVNTGKGNAGLWFQFLLGTLITVPLPTLPDSPKRVSIPLRYADN